MSSWQDCCANLSQGVGVIVFLALLFKGFFCRSGFLTSLLMSIGVLLGLFSAGVRFDVWVISDLFSPPSL
jgi:hypothetical protein